MNAGPGHNCGLWNWNKSMQKNKKQNKTTFHNELCKNMITANWKCGTELKEHILIFISYIGTTSAHMQAKFACGYQPFLSIILNHLMIQFQQKWWVCQISFEKEVISFLHFPYPYTLYKTNALLLSNLVTYVGINLQQPISTEQILHFRPEHSAWAASSVCLSFF